MWLEQKTRLMGILFGAGIGLLALGVRLLWAPLGNSMLLLATWLAVLAVIKPSWVSPFLEYWHSLFRAATGPFVTLGLAAMYWVIVTPAGLALQLVGYTRGRTKDCESYWREKAP